MAIDEGKLRNLRDNVLMVCHALPDAPSKEELAKARDAWLGFKIEVFEQLGSDPFAMRTPWEHIEAELFGHPAWKRFNVLRQRAFFSSPEGKKAKSKQNKRYYQTTLKAQRKEALKDPTHNEEINRKRREAYARKQEAKRIAEQDALASTLSTV